jgi:hypothetical protein
MIARMNSSPSDRVGMAIVRCWSEDKGAAGFRAHVTLVEDVEAGQPREQYYATMAEVVAAVEELLDLYAEG